MHYCCLCKKIMKGTNGPFFKIPKDERRRNIWSQVCQKEFSKQAHICGDHFLGSDIIKRSKRVDLMPNAVPMIQGKFEKRIADSHLFQNPLHVSISSPTNISRQNCDNDISMEQVLSNECTLNTLLCPYNLNSVPFNVPAKAIKYEDVQTQTDEKMFKCTIQAENEQYREIIKKLQEDNVALKLKLAETNSVVTPIKSIFTDGQLRKLMTPGSIHWKWNDISSALCIHASGPRAYNHLYMKGYPLPHFSTLQRWCRRVDICEGFQTASVDLMKHSTELTSEDKICVLAFDEMKVAETFEYDAIRDCIGKPAKYVQVVIARGLRKSWKQPIFFDFDCQITKDILYSIITKLNSAGFPVVAMVCDMGPTNRKLWKELGVTSDKPWFASPVNVDEKVFTFADAPHLLKLIRNHFLDSGLVCNNELLTSRTIYDLLKHTSISDASIAYKLTTEHLSVKGVGRQKVKLAAQLFSNTTANAITRCYSLGMDLYKAIETANFIQLVNDWFDILNSTVDNFNYPGKEPFGMALENQKHTLMRMNNVMSLPLIPNKNSLEWFQKGIIMTNNALVMLHEYVNKRFNMTFILTNRLNQDIVEHIFGALRSKGGLYDHPSPKEFKFRLRKYILARNTELLKGTGNVNADPTQWLGSSEAVDDHNHKQPCQIESGCEDEVTDEIASDPEAQLFDELNTSEIDDVGILQEDALEYISGYIIRKLNLQEHTCHQNTFTWVDQISKGHLIKPTPHFLGSIKKLEMTFNQVNNTQISHSKNIKKYLMERSVGVDLPHNVKNFFVKCRIYFRVRHLNKRLIIQKAK